MQLFLDGDRHTWVYLFLVRNRLQPQCMCILIETDQLQCLFEYRHSSSAVYQQNSSAPALTEFGVWLEGMSELACPPVHLSLHVFRLYLDVLFCIAWPFVSKVSLVLHHIWLRESCENTEMLPLRPRSWQVLKYSNNTMPSELGIILQPNLVWW